MLPKLLLEEIESLTKDEHVLDAKIAHGVINLVFSDYPVPTGYSQTSTSLLLRIPISYPNGKPDMFWTDKDLILQNGSVPRRADVIESYLDREWRRFSWHPKQWDPGKDNLRTYLEFVNTRLAQRV